MADVSGWDAATPSGSSLVSKGDDKFRSVQSDLEETWEEEHFFLADNSGASAGIHRPGSARVDFGTASASTSTDEGRLYYDVDDGVLVVQGSSATTALTGGDARVTGARSTMSNAQIFQSGVTLSSVSWSHEAFDNGGFFELSDGSSTSFRIPDGQDGLYEIHVQMNSAVGGGFFAEGGGSLSIEQNDGSFVLGAIDLPSSLSTIIRSSSTSHIVRSIDTIDEIQVFGRGKLVAGDTVRVRFAQDSGETQAFGGGGQAFNSLNYFEITKIGTV